MTVRRIVTNIAAESIDNASKFYRDLLGLELVMDQGFIQTFASTARAPAQISVATEGGSGTAVPDVSIEVDNVDEVFQAANAGGWEILYGIVNEPWGVRRFYVRDPYGRVVNVMEHIVDAQK